MKQLHFQEKYPITVVDIAKSETRYDSVAAIADYFKDCIANTPRVSYIGTFDHYAHTQAIGGEIAPDIRAATNVLFCFGHALPNAQVLAVRSVAEAEQSAVSLGATVLMSGQPVPGGIASAFAAPGSGTVTLVYESPDLPTA